MSQVVLQFDYTVHKYRSFPESVTEPKIGLQVPEEEIENQDIVMAGLASSSVLNDLLSLHSAVWKLSFVAQRMTLICESRFLRLSFKLGNHFDYDYEKHFKIGDMDVDVAQAGKTVV